MTNCADDGTQGTLRYEIEHAMEGDTIDLSQLACSTITLDPSQSPAPIQIPQGSLYLKGPSAGARYLTIDGGNHSAVLQHWQAGTLFITDLTIANGSYTSDVAPEGGCIHSTGSVSLSRSVVTHCSVTSSTLPPRGGGIYALGSLSLFASTISDSHAIGTVHHARGGGAYVGGAFTAMYSTISNNSALSKYADHVSTGGGVATFSDVTIQGSTVSGNASEYAGGLLLYTAGAPPTISNSTISENTASGGFGGLWTDGALTLNNSTIAFNRTASNFIGAGLYLYTALTLQSSIIADNGNADGPSDLGGKQGIVVMGAHNLITSSTLPLPIDTTDACPQLEPLVDTGGAIKTHALRHTSQAIDAGSNPTGLLSDQRLFGRTWGLSTDIGSVEWRTSDKDERVFAGAFDGLCDQ